MTNPNCPHCAERLKTRVWLRPPQPAPRPIGEALMAQWALRNLADVGITIVGAWPVPHRDHPIEEAS
jgi:hypothetical protein